MTEEEDTIFVVPPIKTVKIKARFISRGKGECPVYSPEILDDYDD